MRFAASLDKLCKRPMLLGLVLAVWVLLLYLPVRHHGFLRLWDDDAYVTDNPHVASGLTIANVRWALTSFEQSNWHPLTWISHMTDCQLFGLSPFPPHYENVLLHAANVFLLFWILQRATGAAGRSFFVAFLFAVHPLNVETVAWIAQRKSLLSAFFSFLAVAVYGWYLRNRRWPRYLVLVFAFVLALMAKPMAVTLPLSLLLFDFWPLHREEELPFLRRWSKLAFEKLPLLSLSAASSVLTERAQNSGGSVMALSLLPISTRMQNAAISCVAYIGKIFWPVKLAAYYPLQLSPALGDAIASTAILIAITALAVGLSRSGYLLTGWFFFLIASIPVIGIVQVGFQGMADRYMYIPAIGIFIMMVWGLASLIDTLPAMRRFLPLAGIVVIVVLSLSTTRYLSCWKDPVTLFAQARNAWGRPDMWLEQLYGNALFSAGRVDEALEHYQESCAIQPRTEYCHYNIAHIYFGKGQFRDAIREYQLALRFTANREMALLCLNECSEAWLQLGDFAAAERSVSQALALDPENAAALQLRQQITQRKNGRN